MDLRLSFAIVLWLMLLGVALIPLIKKGEVPAFFWWKVLVLFLGILAVALPVWRLRSVLYNGEINVDESQLLAQLLRYKIDPIPWRGVDGGSSGPLNTWAITWAPLLGLKPDYFAARITGLICLWAMLSGLTLALGELAGRRIALLLAMPAVTLLLTSLNLDYLFFSSEQLPIALMAWVVYALALQVKKPSKGRAYFVGLLTGALPFCKIQVGPAAVYLWMAGTGILYVTLKDLRKAAGFLLPQAIGGLTASALILGPVIAAGAWSNFVDFYLKAALTYKSSVTAAAPVQSKLGIFTQLITGVPEFFVFWIILFVIAALSAPQILKHLKAIPRGAWMACLSIAGFALISVYSIYRTGFPFPHYTLLLILPVTLLAAVPLILLSFFKPASGVPSALMYAAAFLIVAVQGGTAARELSKQPQFLKDWGNGIHPIAEVLKQHVQPGDTMFVWGYAPKFYVFSGIPPASRFIQSSSFLTLSTEALENPKGHYQSLLADLEQYKPALFVDAADEFWFPDPTIPRGVMARHLTMPAVAQFVAKYYQPVLQMNTHPQKVPIVLYKRKREP
jgi:hypothetical protein